MSRVIGVIPTKNEADNWLDACLTWASNYRDHIVVLDDQSDDDTVAIAEKHTPYVWSRPDFDPPLLEHEAHFRQSLWDAMEQSVDPEDGDWILAFDADEFLVGGFDDRISHRLALLREAADEMGASSVKLSRPEIWELGQPPKYRTDGYWQTEAVRFVKWTPNAKFLNRNMACGSVPKNLMPPLPARSVQLLHLGYSSEESRKHHFHRYNTMKDHGHNKRHVASIIDPSPTLTEYHGPMPQLWKGVR